MDFDDMIAELAILGLSIKMKLGWYDEPHITIDICGYGETIKTYFLWEKNNYWTKEFYAELTQDIDDGIFNPPSDTIVAAW